MEQLIRCGSIARHPYYIRELGINIYTAEEFCYYVYNNTYLLDDDFIQPAMINFFRKEIDMPELADKIIKYYETSADMGNVLVIIMRDINYYTENQIAQFQDRLNHMRKQNPLERSRERADLLLEKKRYEAAVMVYSRILQNPRDIRQKTGFYEQVLQHMGVAYLRMGYTEEAAECFQAAYAEDRNEEILEQLYYLALVSEKPFARELETASSKQLSAWQKKYLDVQTKLLSQSAKDKTVAAIQGDSEEDPAIADKYIAERKKEYCFMVINE